MIQTLADLGTFLAALGTLLLTGRAFAQLRRLTQQISVAREATYSANRGADAATVAEAARDAVREASRSRADQQAPRVVALIEAPEWPPVVDMHRDHMPQREELRLLDPMSVHRSRVGDAPPFTFPRDISQFCGSPPVES